MMRSVLTFAKRLISSKDGAEMVAASNTQITYRCEQLRAVASGILETAGNTFLLLIAVRQLHAGATAKALVAGGGSLGLMFSPLVVAWVSRRRMKTARAASRLAAAGAACFLLMAALPLLPIFVAGSLLAMAASTSVIPLLTQMYQENYPSNIRGHLFSRTFMIRIGAAALFSEFAGEALNGHIQHFQILLLIFALAFALASFCLSRCPSRPLSNATGSHPLRSLRFVREDPLFRRTLICWMFMGFANLMMVPMRVEYLANPRYGMTLSVGEIAFLVGVVPNAARLIMSPIWGLLFDRINFFLMRVVLNLGFALGIFSFFTSSDVSGLIFGSVIFGISTAGGDVAWSLWVTKFSPPEHVADYMSVHTCTTGMRGILAPLVSFHVAQQMSIKGLGWLSVGLILISCMLLVPEVKFGRNVRRTEPLVEEISD
jgi:MFS family permease